jgi:hypothetical protein
MGRLVIASVGSRPSGVSLPNTSVAGGKLAKASQPMTMLRLAAMDAAGDFLIEIIQ